MTDAVMEVGSTIIMMGLPSGFFARTKKEVVIIWMSVKPAAVRTLSMLVCCACVAFCPGSIVA